MSCALEVIINWVFKRACKHISVTTMPMATRLGRVVTYHGWLPPIKLHGPLIRWSVTNWNHCPHYCNAFGHQAWQGGDIQWGFATHKITWSFNHVTYWGHRKNYTRYISTCTRPMGSKLGNLVTYHERLLPINSNDSLITWPTCVTNWKKIYLYFHDFGNEVQDANS